MRDLPAQAPAAGRPPVLVVADLAFDGSSANAVQPGDPDAAGAATAHLRRALGETTTLVLADPARAAAEVRRADQPGQPCSASAECMRGVGRRLSATWVVTGRLSKVSNLIWYLSAQLVDVASGAVLLADSIELKGERDEMLPRGAASLGRRIARAARTGGVQP